MVDSTDNLTRLKSMIDTLGDQWDHDSPTRIESYEGTEHLIMFAYHMTGDWKEFAGFLGEAKNEIDTIIEMAE